MIRGDEALRAEVAQLRAKKGPQRYHLPDEKGFIPLHQCASFGLVVECQTLLEDGANIRQLDSLGHTPLHCAAAMGRAEIIKLLLDHKANIRALSVQGMSPLQSAQRFNRPEACEILRQAELREDFQRKLPELLEQKPPGVVLFNSVRLHLRCGLCDGNRLFCGLPQWKSIMGLKTECFECEGVVPMNSVFTHVVGDVEKVICVIAPTVSEPELLELLSSVGNFTPADALALSALPSASKYDIQHGQQLMDSIIRGDLEGLRSYFNGNNIDNVLYKGKTPLWYASFYGRADLVRWLLDQGAKVNAMSANFETPLHAAAFNRSSEVVMELVSRGAVVDAVDAKANTPLHNAIQSDRADAGVALMEAGANIVDLNAKLPERQWAVKYDQVLEIEGLLLAAFDRGDSFDPDYMIDTGFEFHDKSSTSPRGVTIVGRRVSWARLHELLDDLNGLLEQNPKDITRYIQRGDIFRRFNRLSESLVDYGVALRLSNHPLEALEAFNRAVLIDPENVIAHLHRGNLLRTMNRPYAALAAYETASQLDPENATAQIKLGSLYRELGDLDKALIAYDRARELDPARADVHSKRGWVLAGLARRPEALDAYNRVLELKPKGYSAHHNRICLLQVLHNWSQAAESCVSALQIFPNDEKLEALHERALEKLQESDPSETDSYSLSCIAGR